MDGSRLVIIGGGNMARAIVRGAVESRLSRPSAFVICEPVDERRREFERGAFRARVVLTTARIRDAVRDLGPLDQVLLAVKPQSLGEVAMDLAPALGPARRVIITILAGTPTARIRGLLGNQTAVVRVMPNLSASIRRAISAVCLGDGAAPGDEAMAVELFSGCGEVVLIQESQMDAFTALAGSGPAYVFHLAEAMERAAAEMGFDAPTARRIVRRVIEGSAALLTQSADSPAALREAVTSRGGTTEAALLVMGEAGVLDATVRAILAARDRGAALARE